jgi:enoyl-CoA hydratase
MTARTFELVLDAGVAELRFDAPQNLNALTLAGIQTLGAAVRQLRADPAVRCLVIASTGKHFTAGLDLAEFVAADDRFDVTSARARRRFEDRLTALMSELDVLDRAPFPVIAAIQGGCIGAGVDLVTACDLRLCSADAFFVIQEINVGLAADLGTLQRLAKLIPSGLAREYAYTGRRLTAERGWQIGFVNSVHPTAADTLVAARALAREIADKSPLAIATSKQALNFARDHDLRTALEHMATLQSARLSLEEIRESVAAHQAGRPPKFEDL